MISFLPLLIWLVLVVLLRAAASHHDEPLTHHHRSFGHAAPLQYRPVGTRADQSDAKQSKSMWTRAEAMSLVSQMTLDEKVNLTTGVYPTGCVGSTGSVPRLGIPLLCFADGPSGIRNRLNVSQFPSQITAAATWDVDLISERAAALAQEFHDVGANVMLGPLVGGPSGRSPLGGRYWESNGGDEYLSGAIAFAATKSAQEKGIVVTLKHFFGYEQETARGVKAVIPSSQQPYNVRVDDTTVHQTYMWPFAEGVRAGGGLVMCVYNRINGQHGCSSNETLNGLLKSELHFQGAVISDWGATWSLDDSVNHGMDLLMPGDGEKLLSVNVLPNYFGTNGKKLKEAVKEGRIPESRVDDMVSRILAAPLHYQSGLKGLPPLTLDAGNTLTAPHGNNGKHPSVQSDHYKIIRKIGTESLTLLKNNYKNGRGLPIDVESIKTIAVIGADAGPHNDVSLACDAAGDCLGAPGRTVTIGEGSAYAIPPYISDPLSAIKSYLSAHKSSVKVLESLDTKSHSHATDIAHQSDVAVVFAGQVRAEAFDLDSYSLDKFDNEQINKVAAANANTIVVLHVGGPASVEEWIDHPNVTAVLWAYYPGQESGNGLVFVLFGDESPSGRLPFTIAKSINDYEPNNLQRPASDDNDPQIDFSEGDLIDWKWFDTKGTAQPRFYFGEGLSYTTFKYGELSLSETHKADSTSIQPTNEVLVDETVDSSDTPKRGSLYDTTLALSIPVTNSGQRAGKEVVQLYVSLPQHQDTGEQQEAKHILRGFVKLSLQPGETKTAKFEIRNKDLARWDRQRQAWVKRKGTYTFFAAQRGAGSWKEEEGTSTVQVAL